MKTLKDFDFSKFQLTEKEYLAKHAHFPYVLKLKSGVKSLLYYGTRHTNNPDDFIFQDLPKKLKAFKPDLVVVEGWYSINTMSKAALQKLYSGLSLADSALRWSEAGYVTGWAVQNGVKVLCPEPKPVVETRAVLKAGISKADLYLYYVARMIHQHYRNGGATLSDKGLSGFIGDIQRKELSEWQEWDFSVANFKKLFRKAMGEHYIHFDKEKFSALSTPFKHTKRGLPWFGPNQAAQVSSQLRDRHIVKQLILYFKKYNRIFAIYGGSHTVVQEPILKALFKSGYV